MNNPQLLSGMEAFNYCVEDYEEEIIISIVSQAAWKLQGAVSQGKSLGTIGEYLEKSVCGGNDVTGSGLADT